jgi:hypothetical protein
MDAKPHHRWFQFSLGGFLAALTVGGILLGVYADRAHRQRDAVNALRNRGSLVSYDYPGFDSASRPPAINRTSAWRDWMIDHLGQDYAANVQSVTLAVEAKKSGVRSPIANDRLRIVSQFTELEMLFMSGVDVDDAGLGHLQKLRKLKILSLSSTKVDDDALRFLAGMVHLEYLDLNGTRVSDEGVRHLEQLSKLRFLNLRRTRVTAQGANQLQKALPSCQIGI